MTDRPAPPARRPLLIAALVALSSAAAGCSPPAGETDRSTRSGRLDRAEIARAVAEAMDRSADPCRDFYRFACGGWLDATPLPDDQARWVRSFSVITERNRDTLRAILEEVSRRSDTDPDRRKLGVFYAACMDEERIEARRARPLDDALAQIDAITGLDDAVRVAARLQAYGARAFFAFFVDADYRDPAIQVAQFHQGGLGLPDRDYYLADRFANALAAYRQHIARMLVLLGVPATDAAAQAERIVAFETRLARASRTRAALRDPDARYHRIDVSGLRELAPHLDWSGWLDALGRADVEAANVTVPEFFRALDEILPATPIGTLREYLRWHLVRAAAPFLSRAFVAADFEFYGRTLRGQRAIQPRWKRCVQATDGALGEILGREFVARRFAGDSKARALEMIHALEASLEEGFGELAWMDDATRRRAAEKIHAIGNKIGYPDRWRDYAALVLNEGDWFGNVVAANAFEFRRQLAKVGRPTDRDEWGITPPTVNAYYNPTLNEIVFPAGILQPPFFHRDFPDAMNFGAMGYVVGHEITHGFDDSGRKFDGQGRLREWWEPEVADRFEERAACVRDLYSGLELAPGLNVDGQLTLGENIADLGGLAYAWRTFQRWKRDHGGGEPLVEGLTDDQLFFVAAAQVWCQVATPEIEQQLLVVDTHAPARFRAVVPAQQLPAFAEAFACPAGSPMNPPDRCRVW